MCIFISTNLRTSLIASAYFDNRVNVQCFIMENTALDFVQMSNSIIITKRDLRQ